MAKGCGHCVCIKGYKIYIYIYVALRGLLWATNISCRLHFWATKIFFATLMSIKGYEKIIVAQKVYEWATTL